MSIAENTTSLTLSLDAFVRSISINRATPHGFFLGAGASIQIWRPISRQLYLAVEARTVSNQQSRP
jgi:hypothetical protein